MKIGQRSMFALYSSSKKDEEIRHSLNFTSFALVWSLRWRLDLSYAPICMVNVYRLREFNPK